MELCWFLRKGMWSSHSRNVHIVARHDKKKENIEEGAIRRDKEEKDLFKKMKNKKNKR